MTQLNSLIGNYFSIYKDSLLWYKKKNPSYVEENNINFYIKTYTEGTNKLFEYMKDSFPEGMERKLNIWKEYYHGRLATTSSYNRKGS